ncbi:MAG TPA: sialidase family protein, partial [Spirochaetia bacterium]|nr:sialidase family protein [Spirochaetia bacterium]
MTRHPRSLLGGATALAIAGLLWAAAPALADITIPTQPRPPGPPNLDLLKPIEDILSSKPALIVMGKDPRVQASTFGEGEAGGGDAGGSDSTSGASTAAAAKPSPVLQAAGGFLVPFRNPAPAFSRGILITRDYSDFPVQTEPHIAVDPADPDHVVVATIDYNSPSVTDYVTYDGGVTWEGPFPTGYLPEDEATGGDPVLDFDRKGNLYLATISIGTEEFTVGPEYTSSIVSSIAVAQSKDGGYTWPSIISTARSNVSITGQQIDAQGHLRGSVQIGFFDKPWISIGRNPAKPDQDVIYAVYVEFITYYDIIYTGELPILLPREVSSTIKLVHSEDQGTTWSDPIAVSPVVRRAYGTTPGVALPGVENNDRTLQGPRVEAAMDGTVYVAWLDTTD